MRTIVDTGGKRLRITKESLAERINLISERAKEYDNIGVLIISKCQSLYEELDKIKETDSAKLERKLTLFKFNLDKMDIILADHKSGKNLAYGSLSTRLNLNVTYILLVFCILIYSDLFVFIDSYNSADPMQNINVYVTNYLKYFLVSVMGALLYFITDSMVVYSKSMTRILVAMFIPVLFLGVLFTPGETQNLDLSSTNVMLFLFGYSSNLISILLNKAIKKVEQLFNVQQ